NTSSESILRRSYSENLSFEELSDPQPPVSPSVAEDHGDADFVNEPPLDFSIKATRDMLSESIKKVKSNPGARYPIVIGQENIFTDRKIVSRNPSKPDEVVGHVSMASEELLEKAIHTATSSQSQWERTSPAKRVEYLYRAADIMRRERYSLAALQIVEVGKTWPEADGDVTEAIDFLRYYGGEMLKLGSPKRLGSLPGEDNLYHYTSRGVGAVIAPWNFPLAIATGMLSAAIVTGNCAILKPSSLSPVTAWRLVDIFREAGIPPGVIAYLPGYGHEIGDGLVSHPLIDFITFTGSMSVGLNIVKQAGNTPGNQRNVKKVIAEMGGKNAIIVDDTADLDEAVRGVLGSAIGYQGQKCSACSRVIALKDIQKDFTERLKEAMASVKVGSPRDPSTTMGPLIDETAIHKVTHYIKLAEREGEVILRGERLGDGYFITPTLVTNVKPDSPLAQEEIFGPVLSIITAETIDEAITIANNSIYALTGGIYSRSPHNIQKIRDELQVGNLYINRKITGAMVSRQPFGGYAMSGVGSKAGGPDYLLQFMNPRTITENTLRRGFAPSLDSL
ncbi:MAG: L-glutamate gamma-semialdehyde dehydrogenase, partial [Spirochaetota bacterium]|nr:L-glutamate gamma-semialdehyde dehydrogenase [Spirochaetota bacterium]